MDTGSIAWMLTASVLVLFMTPGLAFFYGGLVRGRNVVSTLMYSFIAMGLQPRVRRRQQHRLDGRTRIHRFEQP